MFRPTLVILASVALVTSAVAVASATAVPRGAVQPPGETQVVTAAPRATGPHVRGEGTVPVYSYANAIRESVRVPTGLDADGDGVNDTVVVDVVRPREAAAAGVKVPVIAVVSPYFTNRDHLRVGSAKQYDNDGAISFMPHIYDNYFVERGYAVAAVDVIGTGRSTGCPDVGGPMDVGAMTAALNWLHGTTTGTYIGGGSGAAQATWSTGQYGLIGKSYDATLANAAASRGLDGLKTTVVMSGISSWYDYVRQHGVVTRPGYMGYLGSHVTNNAETCEPLMQQLTAAQDDRTGNYNDFFDVRNYVKDAAKVKASVFAVHGHNDFNVTANNTGQWLDALRAHGVPTKLWISQAEHTDPFDHRRAEWMRQIHGWFDHWLQGLASPVMQEPQLDVQNGPGQWTTYPSYPLASPTSIGLAPGTIGAAGTGVVSIKDSRFDEENAMAARAPHPGKAVFLSAPLAKPFTYGGAGWVTLRVRSNQAGPMISAKLVDYGPDGQQFVELEEVAGQQDCLGSSTPTDSGCSERNTEKYDPTTALVIGRGWMSSRHRDSTRTPSPMPAGQWVTLRVPLHMNVATVRAGHQLGLVIGGNDGMSRGKATSTFDVDLAGSTLHLPTSDAGLLSPAPAEQR